MEQPLEKPDRHPLYQNAKASDVPSANGTAPFAKAQGRTVVETKANNTSFLVSYQPSALTHSFTQEGVAPVQQVVPRGTADARVSSPGTVIQVAPLGFSLNSNIFSLHNIHSFRPSLEAAARDRVGSSSNLAQREFAASAFSNTKFIINSDEILSPKLRFTARECSSFLSSSSRRRKRRLP